MITTALTSSCHRENLLPFCLRKKRPENALTMNYRKIMPFKTALNWLFNDMGCYLVIGDFD